MCRKEEWTEQTVEPIPVQGRLPSEVGGVGGVDRGSEQNSALSFEVHALRGIVDMEVVIPDKI